MAGSKGRMVRCVQDDHEDNQASEDPKTSSSIQQMGVEDVCGEIFLDFVNNLLDNGVGYTLEDVDRALQMNRSVHVDFLRRGLRTLHCSYTELQASRPWLVYWIVHALHLLDQTVPESQANDIITFLAKCQRPSGGFAGSPDQEPHLATTYAAINALATLRSEQAYRCINRETLRDFLTRMHQADGSFILHEGGEVDIRGTYLAASVARITNVYTEEMFDMTPQWIVSCQTYEGGFGGAPGLEAHGGYAFCGLAALMLLGHEKLVDCESLMRWAVHRQMNYEGGFQGRPNKLVDGCYSFWVGAVFPLLHAILSKQGDKALPRNEYIFHAGALQEYLLLCSQITRGGFVDKPGKTREYYHTCYCLSGLSVAQHAAIQSEDILGGIANKLNEIHPLLNLGVTVAAEALEYFSKASLLPAHAPTTPST